MKDPVLIVGAGPVGLTAAWTLVQHNIPVHVVERSPELTTDWRASTFHSATLELLDRIDVADDLVALGLKAEIVQFRDREKGRIAEFDYGLLKDDTRFPFRLQCPQQKLVQILNERLAASPLARLSFSTRLLRIAQDDEGVTAHVEVHDEPRTLRASYLLGADGGTSTVRAELGVPFEGMTYEDRFLLVSSPYDFHTAMSDLAYVNYVSDPLEYMLILRLPEVWRLTLAVRPEEREEDVVDREAAELRMRRIIGIEESIPVHECTLYRIHQRVAQRFRDGRVMLLGDAAHLNSPMGGMGLNCGIHDAIDMGLRLGRSLTGTGDIDAELDAYSERRRQIALNVVQVITHRNTEQLRAQDPAARDRHHEELRATAADPVRARMWLLQQSMLVALAEAKVGEPVS